MFNHTHKITEVFALASGIIISNYTVYYIISDTCKYRQNIMKQDYEKKIKDLEDIIKINI